MWARPAKEGTFDAKLCSRATSRILDGAVGTGGGDGQLRARREFFVAAASRFVSHRSID
jgi:hypothetical protein